VIGTLMIKEYAQSIMDCALRRRIIEVAETMIAEAHGTEPGLVTSTAAVAAIEQATNRYAVAGTTSIGGAVAVAVAQASARQRGEKTGHYLMTGCKPLDNIWRGLHNGALEILGGRAGSGKTALARQIARHVAAKGAAVAFFSLEMPHADLATADLSSVSGVSMDTIRLGEFDNRQAEAILRAEKYLAQLPIHIVDTPGLPIDQAVSRMRAMVRTVGAKLVIVDHRDQFGRDSKDRDDIGWYRNITQVLKVTEYPDPLTRSAFTRHRAAREQDAKNERSDVFRRSGCRHHHSDAPRGRCRHRVIRQAPVRRAGQCAAAFRRSVHYIRIVDLAWICH